MHSPTGAQFPEGPVRPTFMGLCACSRRQFACGTEVTPAAAHGGGVAVLALVTYAITMYTTVAGGDSGELVAEACRLGTAHPPGYPLLTMLAAGFVRWAPGATPAARANLLSCVCGSAAAGILAAVVAQLTGRFGAVPSATASWLAGLLFAWSPLVWM